MLGEALPGDTRWFRSTRSETSATIIIRPPTEQPAPTGGGSGGSVRPHSALGCLKALQDDNSPLHRAALLRPPYFELVYPLCRYAAVPIRIRFGIGSPLCRPLVVVVQLRGFAAKRLAPGVKVLGFMFRLL